jgi:pimeloyl-ACP methyl ester carboxylesterase
MIIHEHIKNRLKYSLLIAVLIFLLPQFLRSQVKAMDINLEGIEYPFPVKYIQLNIQKQHFRMAYMDITPSKPNGKSILLLHGKNFSSAYWKQTAEALLANGYRVVMPDQIGFGKSSKPQWLQYTFQQLATNTKNLLDTLGIEKVAVLGHSMGGMVAVRFTLMFPETVTKLILENPIGLEDYKIKIPYQSVDLLYQKELKQNVESMRKYQLSSYYDNKWKPQYDEWLNLTAGWTLSKDYPLIAWNNALTTDMIITQPVVYELQNIKAPTLLIIGQRDRTALGKDLVSNEVRETMGYYPELGKQTKAKIPNSQLIEIEGIGHLPHIESFDRFIKPLLAFLNN